MTSPESRLLVVCLLACLAPVVAPATDYFVAPTGDDQAAGTSPATAWKSIARVNAGSFRPGDHILFQGKERFRGNLRLNQESSGSTNAPVVITSFGDGRASLLAGRENGITIESAGYLTISNLVVLGDGPTNNTGYGILCDNRLDEFRRLRNVCIDNVEASGFGLFGILISGKQAGFDHVRVIGCDLHDNLRGGMEIAGRLPWDSPLYAHTDVVVRRCRAHDNSGDPDYDRNHSGSGMVLYQVDGGMIEECRAWGNGRLCKHDNGGVGIWSCASRGIVIQRCESFSNRTSGGDGGGFDLDGGSIDCVLQYNYSHDNDGPGLMVYTYPYASHSDRGCIVRFNVSDHDSRKTRAYAGLWVRSDGNGIAGLRVYNNTVRMGPWSSQAAFIHGTGVEADFRNNIFVGCDAASPLWVEQPNAKLRFVNNLYWAGGSPFRIEWGDQKFTELSAWRQATGQESAEGKPTGLFADPGFSRDSDQTTARGETWRSRLTAFRPRARSVIVGKGQVMRAELPPLEPCLDILGNVLTVERWPLGAVGPDPL